MSISMKDLDPALQGAGQKAYPHSTLSNFIPMFARFCVQNEFLFRDYVEGLVSVCKHLWVYVLI